MDGAPGKLAVADLAAARRAHAAGLAHRVGREIVVQHEGRLVGTLQAVDHLLVLAGAERRDDQRLCLAAREERGAVRARQHAHLREDRAHRLQVAAVDAYVGVEDVPADDLRLQLLERRGDVLLVETRLAALGEERRHHLRLHRIDGGVAILLHDDLVGVAQLALGDLENRLLDLRNIGRRKIARLLGGALGKPDDRVDHRLERAMAEHDGAEHDVLGKLMRLQFDHQHRIGRAGDDEVELRSLHVLHERIEDIIAVRVADTGGGDRPHEGHAGKRQRRGGGDHADDVGVVLKIVREHGDDHLRLVLVAVGEQRTDRPVDQARGQRLLLGRAAFALEEATRNAAGGVVALLVVHGEREEVEARLRLFHGNDGRKNRGLAVGGEHGAVGLARHAPAFEHELPPAPIDFNFLRIKHARSFRSASRTGHAQDGGALRRLSEASERPAILPWPISCVLGQLRPRPMPQAPRLAPSGAVRGAR